MVYLLSATFNFDDFIRIIRFYASTGMCIVNCDYDTFIIKAKDGFSRKTISLNDIQDYKLVEPIEFEVNVKFMYQQICSNIAKAKSAGLNISRIQLYISADTQTLDYKLLEDICV